MHLVESEENIDQGLVTSIGNYYGDIHETVYETAKASNLNRDGWQKNFYNTYMKDVMKKYPAPKL